MDRQEKYFHIEDSVDILFLKRRHFSGMQEFLVVFEGCISLGFIWLIGIM